MQRVNPPSTLLIFQLLAIFFTLTLLRKICYTRPGQKAKLGVHFSLQAEKITHMFTFAYKVIDQVVTL